LLLANTRSTRARDEYPKTCPLPMRRQFSLGVYFACAAAEGIISMTLLALVPSDPENAWLLGRSITRMAMIAAGLGLTLFFAGLAVRSSRDAAWRERLDGWIGDYVGSDRYLTAVSSVLMAGFLTGCYLQFVSFTAIDPLHRSYLVRLAPWSLWFALLCASSLLFIRVHYQPAWIAYMHAHRVSLLTINGVLLLGAVVHMHLGNMDLSTVKTYSASDQIGTPIEQQDIYAVYLEGQNLLNGVNPYTRITSLEASGGKSMLPTYLPIMYYGSWATQRLGLREFSLWLDVWQGIFLLFNLAVAYSLFHAGYFVYGSRMLGIFASLLWLFNRWTLYVTTVFQFDFIPVFLLVISLGLLPRNRLASYLLFGLSLAVKHVAILLIPVYLIWAWRSSDEGRLRQLVIGALAIGTIPFLASLPFIALDPLGFFSSLWFSVARLPGTHMGALSLDALLGWVGNAAKLPMLGLMLLIYWITWKGRLSYYATALLVMLVFLDFNSVLFNQYMVWTAPLIALTVMETTALHWGESDPVVRGPRGVSPPAGLGPSGTVSGHSRGK